MSTIERTTKEIKLERAGAVVVLFDYITGRDKRAIESVYLDQMHMSQKVGADKKGEVEIGGISGSVNHLMQDAALKQVVKEVRLGEEVITDKAKVLNFLIDLPETEYSVVLAAVNEITDPKKA